MKSGPQDLGSKGPSQFFRYQWAPYRHLIVGWNAFEVNISSREPSNRPLKAISYWQRLQFRNFADLKAFFEAFASVPCIRGQVHKVNNPFNNLGSKFQQLFWLEMMVMTALRYSLGLILS